MKNLIQLCLVKLLVLNSAIAVSCDWTSISKNLLGSQTQVYDNWSGTTAYGNADLSSAFQATGITNKQEYVDIVGSWSQSPEDQLVYLNEMIRRWDNTLSPVTIDSNNPTLRIQTEFVAENNTISFANNLPFLGTISASGLISWNYAVLHWGGSNGWMQVYKGNNTTVANTNFTDLSNDYVLMNFFGEKNNSKIGGLSTVTFFEVRRIPDYSNTLILFGLGMVFVYFLRFKN